MSDDEADRFIAALRSGKRFATRFQEQEWSLDALADGTFRKWSHRADIDGDEQSEEIVTEAMLKADLVRWYDYETMSVRLR